jgi:DNA helicase HerA-like ATPase
MEKIDVAGQVIGGKVANILLREKAGKKIELGDLLVVEESDGSYIILQVYDLSYGSQIPQSMRELAAGYKLEGQGSSLEFLDPHLRNYVMASIRGVARVTKKGVKIPKILPDFFSDVRIINKTDLKFLSKPDNPIFLGKVRSGSKILDLDVFLDGLNMFTHHVLVPATTGRGKSNLVKVMLWSAIGNSSFGLLVLDAHDEYYGRGKELGLKNHPEAKDNILFYSPNPSPGTNSLIVNLKAMKPWHFDGIIKFTDAQNDAVQLYYDEYRNEWLEKIIQGTTLEVGNINPRTIAVIQRKLKANLGVYFDEERGFVCKNKSFSNTIGETTIPNIIKGMESGKKVIVDTSRLSDKAELLIGSIIGHEILFRYQEYKGTGELERRPVVSIIIEEAPRVLSFEALKDTGENIYDTIAREGRKFKIGLFAITQLTSVIPTTVLANLNTKIILGNEMASERNAIISSAPQDLSNDDRTIASLDKGEAIVSSIFTNFAVPIQIPLFEDLIPQSNKTKMQKRKFVG